MYNIYDLYISINHGSNSMVLKAIGELHNNWIFIFSLFYFVCLVMPVLFYLSVREDS